ncbi:MAG: cell division protein FtsL [Neisseriaceae bacterium]|nr:cell division protein FtsL [Neisseriaceae bacterium]MBP6862242.1 cell division protein FtsL [Neisseriaceae bacterium]
MNKLNVLLFVLVIASGVAVVTVQDRSRSYTSEIERAQKSAQLLDEQFASMQLEQARLASHANVQVLAQQQGLYVPLIQDVKEINLRQE